MPVASSGNPVARGQGGRPVSSAAVLPYTLRKQTGSNVMILRTLTLAGGLAGAAGLSQFPEFSQQYTQRLAGAVDELSRVVEDFDRSAAALDLSREEALAAMTGSDFVERRRADMERALDRHDRLRADLALLRSAGPFTRAYRIAHFDDSDLARRTAADFKPALPLTFEGVTFAATGLILGMLAVGLIRGLMSLLIAPLRRRPA